MNLITGPKNSWQPVRTGDTTASSYWLNWRFLICAIWVLMSMAFSSFLISKYEGARISRHRNQETGKEESDGILYYDEIWRPCLKGIHPGWLLAYRIIAFFVLLILLIITIAVDGGSILYFYTEWTFALITFYFGLGSLISVYGCYQYHYEVGGDKIANGDLDSEQGSSNIQKTSGPGEEHQTRQIAGFWGYVFQIIFQMNAGAVILTDCVFWFIIVPFLAIKDYDLNFLIINMHSINVVFLLGDTAFNSLRFPWFRIAYFFLWTDVFVIFQWIVHACISLWWPYPFLDLSSPFSPLSYVVLISGIVAYTLLRRFCFGDETETLSLLEMVSSIISTCSPNPRANIRSIMCMMGER